MNSSSFIKFAGFIGIIAPIFGLSAIFTSTLLCGPGCGNPIPPPFDEVNEWANDGSFSWKSNALSDLGISKVAIIFNSSLILLGMLTLSFYIGLAMAYAKSTLFYLGSSLLILASLSVSLVGIFTEAYSPPPHIIAPARARAHFFLGPLGLNLVGLAFVQTNMKTKGYVSILAGIIALLVIIIPWYNWLGLGVAVPEIVAVAVTSVWMVWMSVSLLCPE